MVHIRAYCCCDCGFTSSFRVEIVATHMNNLLTQLSAFWTKFWENTTTSIRNKWYKDVYECCDFQSSFDLTICDLILDLMIFSRETNYLVNKKFDSTVFLVTHFDLTILALKIAKIAENMQFLP